MRLHGVAHCVALAVLAGCGGGAPWPSAKTARQEDKTPPEPQPEPQAQPERGGPGVFPWMVEQERPGREVCFVVRLGKARRMPVFDIMEYFVDLEVLVPLPQPDVYVFASVPTHEFDASGYSKPGTIHAIHLSTNDVNQFARTGTVHLTSRAIRFGRTVAEGEDVGSICGPGTALKFAEPDPTAPDPPRE